MPNVEFRTKKITLKDAGRTLVTVSQYFDYLANWLTRAVDTQTMTQDAASFYLELAVEQIRTSLPSPLRGQAGQPLSDWLTEIRELETPPKAEDVGFLRIPFRKLLKAEIVGGPPIVPRLQELEVNGRKIFASLPFVKEALYEVAYKNKQAELAARYDLEDPAQKRQYESDLKRYETPENFANQWIANVKGAKLRGKQIAAIDKMNPQELAIAGKRGILSKETIAYWRGKQRELAAETGRRELSAAAESRRRVREFGPLGIKEPGTFITPTEVEPPQSIEELITARGEERGGPARFQQFIRGAGAEKALRSFEEGGGLGARQAWWEALTRPRVDYPSYEERLKSIYDEMGRWGQLVQPSPDLPEAPVAQAAPSGLRGTQFAGLQQQAPQVMQELQKRLNNLLQQGAGGYEESQRQMFPAPDVATDPLESYLKSYPWMKKWLKLSPSQRGFQAGRTTPQARWI